MKVVTYRNTMVERAMRFFFSEKETKQVVATLATENGLESVVHIRMTPAEAREWGMALIVQADKMDNVE